MKKIINTNKDINGLKNIKKINKRKTIIKSNIIFSKELKKTVVKSISDVKFLKCTELLDCNNFRGLRYKKL